MTMNSAPHDHALDLCQQLATELVFARPGSDTGLLPVNCLLGQLEQVLTDSRSPGLLMDSIHLVRQWIHELLAGDATFTTTALSQLQHWTVWFEQTLTDIDQGRPATAFQPQAPDAPRPDPGSTSAGPDRAGTPATATPPEPVLIIDAAADGELLREFLNESAEHLQNIEQGVLILEDNPTDAETLNSIFRAFHTFKGGAGFLNLDAIQTLAHELESLLDAARTGKLRITSPIADLILAGGDVLRRFTVEIDAQLTGKAPSQPILIPTRNLLDQVRSILENPSAATSAPPTRPENNAPPVNEPQATPATPPALPQPALPQPAPLHTGPAVEPRSASVTSTI